MRPLIVKKLFYPFHEFLRGRSTPALLSQLDQTQWLSPETLKVYQWKKLKKLLIHAYNHVPYYRSLFKSLGMCLGDIKHENDFQQIPLLTKDLIRENFSSLIAKNFRHRIIKSSTGGSTGEPLTFYTDRTKESAHNAAKLRARRWWGVEVGDKEMNLWGSPIELSKQHRFRVFKDKHFMNLIVLSSTDLSDRSMNEYLSVMRSFQPTILYGYATALFRFAQFIERIGGEHGIESLRAIFSTSEMLYGHQREKIANIFQRPVVNEYGCRDGGYVGQECPAGNMHVAMEHVYVEFIPLPTEPEVTQLVVTNLDGYGMPFIRYAVGDLAQKKDATCPCGRGLMLLDSLQGRNNDMLVSPTGKVFRLSVIDLLKDIQGIRQFRMTQEEVDRITVEIVSNNDFQPLGQEVIGNRLRKLMESPVDVEVVHRDEIPADKSGKYRWIVSKVNSY